MIRAHELYVLAQNGYGLHERFWTPETIERAAKYDMGSHLSMPSSLVYAGEVMLKSGRLRLPHDYVIFEYDTADQQFERLALLCWQLDAQADSEVPGLIASAPLIRQSGRWSEFMMAVWFSFAGEVRTELSRALDQRKHRDFLDQLTSMAYALTIGGVAALQPGASQMHFIEIPSASDPARSQSGKPSFFPHWQVVVARTDH